MLNSLNRTVAIVSVTALAMPLHALGAQSGATMQCRPLGAVVKMNELAEASGIAASRRTPGTLWAINDSGDPVVYALDAKGAVTGRVRVTGAQVEDWEAIAAGPCKSGSCLYVGDIGDNNGTRKQITIYRVPEPAVGDDMPSSHTILRASSVARSMSLEAPLVICRRHSSSATRPAIRIAICVSRKDFECA